MTTRREVLAMAAAAGAAGLLARSGHGRAEAAAWKPFRDTVAVDGEGGLFMLLSATDEEGAADLAAARASGLAGALLTVAPNSRFRYDVEGFEKTKELLANCRRKIAAHPDALLLVDTAADLQRARRERRLGVIPRFQGCEPLGEHLDRVQLFRELGVRVIQLTQARRNLAADDCMEANDGGLSAFGHKVVEELNARKVVVDLAHGSPRTIAEGIRASKAPVLISHTGCRALADVPRNTGDENLRALADRGGVAGIVFWPYLRTDRQPTASDVIAHIEHVIKVCGEDHVGIGTDCAIAPIERTPEYERQNRENIQGMIESGWLKQKSADGVHLFITDLNVANRFEVLAGLLSARGHSDARIAKILGGNFARVFGEVWG
jgi:membrane dipeptidase